MLRKIWKPIFSGFDEAPMTATREGRNRDERGAATGHLARSAAAPRPGIPDAFPAPPPVSGFRVTVAKGGPGVTHGQRVRGAPRGQNNSLTGGRGLFKITGLAKEPPVRGRRAGGGERNGT